jgi:hypothetical protein
MLRLTHDVSGSRSMNTGDGEAYLFGGTLRSHAAQARATAIRR